MVVLVDANTASAAEIVTGALQDHRRATVVGTHTFGKGVFQEEEPLSNGGALDITVGEYFTPNGRNLGGGGVRQGAGIDPEVRVPQGRRHATAGWTVALRHARRQGQVSAPARRPFVAVLERRGRFLTAEPLFRADRPGGPRRRARLVGSSRPAALARRRAAPGMATWCWPARRARPRGASCARIGRPDVARDVIEALMLDRGLAARVRPGGRARGRARPASA